VKTPTQADAPMLDRDGPVSLYLQVATDIAGRIGQDPAFRDRLPSEAELVARYAVSRITVRLALDHLARRGLVVRRQGRGTFVSEPREQRSGTIRGLADILSAQGLEADTALLFFGPADAPDAVQDALALPDADSMFLRRRYRVQNQDAALTEVYYPPFLRGAFSREDAEQHSSVVLLSRFAGLQLGRADSVIRVQPASGALRAHLDIEPNSAVMVIRRVTYTAVGEPCEYSTLFAKAGIAEFAVTTSGDELNGQVRARMG
jgi:GntR family transcriptional regulator